ADAIDWDWLDGGLADRFSDTGRPGTETRFMVGLLLLQHVHAPSDEGGRIADRLEVLLQESLRVAHDTGALKKDDLARITVDTTVQPKNVTHPTDAKLMLTAI